MKNKSKFTLTTGDYKGKPAHYEDLKERDQLAKFECYTNYDQLPLESDYDECLVKVKTIFTDAFELGEWEDQMQQNLDSLLLMFLHCYKVQGSKIQELNEQINEFQVKQKKHEEEQNHILTLR